MIRSILAITIRTLLVLVLPTLTASDVSAQQSVLPTMEKITNYLPHMTVPDVQDLRTRSDMVIIPVASLEQHGLHLPIGTDYLNGVTPVSYTHLTLPTILLV